MRKVTSRDAPHKKTKVSSIRSEGQNVGTRLL